MWLLGWSWFAIYRKFPEKAPVAKEKGTRLLESFEFKFLGSTEFLKGSPVRACLLGQNVQTKIRVSFVKTHVSYRSGFHGHFSFNGTELYMGEGGGGFYKLIFLEVLLFRS